MNSEQQKVINISNQCDGIRKLKEMGYCVTLDGRVYDKQGRYIVNL